MKALYTEIENISLFVSSSKDTYEKMETRLSRESQFNTFYNSIPNSYYGVWWNGIPITNKDVGEAVQGRGEMPNPVPALMAWYQDLEKGTKVFFGNARQVVEGIGCGAVDAAKELVYGVADIGKFVYNLGFGLSEFMMDDPFGKSEAWIKQNGSKELKNFIRLKWGGELLPKLWDLSQNKFIESKDKFTKADLKTKSAMATNTVVNLLLIFVPASKIPKIGKSAEVVEGLSKVEKSAETVSKVSLAEKEVKAVEGISKVEKEAKAVEGLTKANRSVREAEKVSKGGSNSSLYDVLSKLDTPEARYDFLLDRAKAMDVSTPKNGAIFYAGRVNNVNGTITARQMAEKYADQLLENKGVTKLTLERTSGGKWMDNSKLYDKLSDGTFKYESLGLNKSQADDLWKTLSGRYADGANGAVTAFVKDVPDAIKPKTVFYSTELPELRFHNDKVTHINIR